MSSHTFNVGCKTANICVELNRLLHVIHPTPQSIFSCTNSNAWPCESLVQNSKLLYQLITPSNVDQILTFLKSIFHDQDVIVNYDTRLLMKARPFSCPDLGINMYQPCQVDSCAFHTAVPLPFTQNCILYYRIKYSAESLTLNDLAMLYNEEDRVIRARINKVLKSLSSGALKEVIVQENSPEMMVHLNTSHVCVVCETNISKGKAVIKSGFQYCSRACYNKKPPVAIKIETDFKLPAEHVLRICVEKFSTFKSMCNAVGVGPPVFKDLCARYNIYLPPSLLPTSS